MSTILLRISYVILGIILFSLIHALLIQNLSVMQKLWWGSLIVILSPLGTLFYFTFSRARS